MTPFAGPMLQAALVTAAVLLALPSAALAADAKPAAQKARPANAPAGKASTAKKAPVARAPIDPGPPTAGPDQLAAADQVYYGSHECEFNQTIQVTPLDPRKLSYLTVLTPQSPDAKRRAGDG